MEAIDLLLNRRSVVVDKMTEPGPSDADVKTILTAGMRVPDHALCMPWRIQVVHKEGQKALGELYVEIYKRENPDAEERLVEIERNRPQRAPIMLAVTAQPNMEKAARIPLMEQKLSGGALCMNILNAANALGFASQWITQWPAYHPEVKKALGHSPDTEIIGFIFIGTPAEPPKERVRPDFDKIVSEWRGNPVG